jgi:hypothetical protein
MPLSAVKAAASTKFTIGSENNTLGTENQTRHKV